MCVCVRALPEFFNITYAANFLLSCWSPPHSPSSVAHFSLFELSGMRSHKFVVVVVRLCLSVYTVSLSVWLCMCVCLLRFWSSSFLACFLFELICSWLQCQFICIALFTFHTVYFLSCFCYLLVLLFSSVFSQATGSNGDTTTQHNVNVNVRERRATNTTMRLHLQKFTE